MGYDARQLLNEYCRHKALTPEQEVEVFREVAKGCLNARSKAIRHNLRWVAKIAIDRHEVTPDVELEELVQWGVEGLIEAIEHFRLGKGAKFSTYSWWWIRQGINRGLANHRHTIRTPAHAQEDAAKVRKFFYRFQRQHGRKPSPSEIMEGTGLTQRALDRVVTVISLQTKLSLDQPLKGDHSGKEHKLLGDALENQEEAYDPATLDLQDGIQKMLDCHLLDPRERQAVVLKFGLDRGYSRSLGEVAEEMGVCRERARQLYGKGLKKMKIAARWNKITPELLEVCG